MGETKPRKRYCDNANCPKGLFKEPKWAETQRKLRESKLTERSIFEILSGQNASTPGTPKAASVRSQQPNLPKSNSNHVNCPFCNHRQPAVFPLESLPPQRRCSNAVCGKLFEDPKKQGFFSRLFGRFKKSPKSNL